MTEIDSNTGLPKLPEGYFWRVLNGHEVGGLGVYPGIEVQLMKHSMKLHWFKRVPCVRVMKWAWEPREDLKVGEVDQAIKKVARTVYKRYKDHLPIHDEINAEIEKYAGDYPPKKFEGA